LLIEGAGIDRPVDVVRFFQSRGLSLKRAHQVLDRVVSGGRVAIELTADDVANLLANLARFGIHAAIIRPPSIDAKAVRESLSLSQAEFAIRFGLELDTIQNWEQSRNTPDPAAKLLLGIIQASPEIVERVLTQESQDLSAVGPGGKPFSKQ
jgi:DNA-binding transcriptional regulator YiaG